MPNPRLARVLFISMLGVLICDLVAFLVLSSTHQPPVGLLVSATATIPGFVMAGLASRGKLPNRCGPSTQARRQRRRP